MLPQLVAGCRYYSDWLTRYFRIMIMDEKNLFSLVGRMALGVRRSGQNDSELSVMLDHILEQINNTETLLLEYAGVNLHLDRQRMEETYFALLSDDTGSLDAFDQEDLKVLDHSVQQILDYAEVSDETAEKFAAAVEAFLACVDKFARTPEATALRKELVKYFFEIYERACKKSFQDANPPLAVKLFLRYGYVSEELLTEEELRTLLTLPDSREEETTCRVYTMSEWLREIYEGRKNPSKDEFDTDYEETIRKQVHEKKLTKTEGDDAFHDADKRLHFEVENLLSYADRILSGNISTFVPVMCSEGIYTKLESAVVTSAIINKIVNRVEKIDYSIFYREQMGRMIRACREIWAGVMDQWMNSSGHKANILLEKANTIGIGCYYIDGGYTWVQVFSDETADADCTKLANKDTTAVIEIPKERLLIRQEQQPTEMQRV
mgnify:CR=1 FL=1